MGLPHEDGGGFQGLVWEPRMGLGPNTTAPAVPPTPAPTPMPPGAATPPGSPPAGGSRSVDQRGGERCSRGRTEER